MNMDNIIRFGICRCCLTEGTHRDFRLIFKVQKEDVDAQIPTTAFECYSDMFVDCYKFPLLLDNATTLICLDCIKKLRMALEFKNTVLESTKQLLSLSVDPQNFTKVNADDANDTTKEKNENTKIEEQSSNEIEHISAGLNVDETNITGIDNQQMKIIEFIDNVVDQSCIQENKDPVISLTGSDLVKSNNIIIKKAFGFAPSVVGNKDNEFTVHNGLKVTIVKANKEKDDNKCEEMDLTELSSIAVAEQDNQLPLRKGNTNTPTKSIVVTEKQEPIIINNFLQDTIGPISDDCAVLSMKRPRKASEKLEDEQDEFQPSPRRKKNCKCKPKEKKEKSTKQKKETVKKTYHMLYPRVKNGKKQKTIPVPDYMSIASEAINAKSKTKQKVKLPKTNLLNEEVPGWSKPKPVHSYSGKKGFNKIRISEPVSIDTFQFDSISQHVEETPAETLATEKETATPDLPNKNIVSLSTTQSDSEMQKIDLDINDISIEAADKSCMTQLQTTSLMEDIDIGFLSFSKDLELDDLPIPTFFTDDEVVSIENILPLKNKDLSKDARCATLNQPWRMDVKNKSNEDDALKKSCMLENTSHTSKDKLSKNVDVDLTKDNIACQNLSYLPNDNEEDEEQKAYREWLLSGYVKKAVVVDQNEYKQKMKELLRRGSKVAYKCKICSLVFISESNLLEHKKIHEAAALQRERVEEEGGAATNAQTPKTLTVAPGVKVINPMYKTNNKGLMMIYASGNCFYKSWTTEDKRVAWVCRTHHQCTATLHTSSDEIVAYNAIHTPRLNYKPTKNLKLNRKTETKISNEENKESIKKINAKKYCNNLPQTQTNSTIKKYCLDGVIKKKSSRDGDKGDSDANDSIKSETLSNKGTPIRRPKRENRRIPRRYETCIRGEKTSSPGQKHSEDRNSLSSTDERGISDKRSTHSSKGVTETERSGDLDRSGDSEANNSIKSGTLTNKCTLITRPKRVNRQIPKRYETYIGPDKETPSPGQKHSEDRNSLSSIDERGMRDERNTLSSKGVTKTESPVDHPGDHERSGDSDANDSIKSGTSSNKCTPIVRPKRENRQIPKRYETYIRGYKETPSPGQKHSEDRNSLSTAERGMRDKRNTHSSKGVTKTERSADHDRSGDSDANDSIKSGSSSNKCTPITRPKRENRQIPKRYETYIRRDRETPSPGQKYSEDRKSLRSIDESENRNEWNMLHINVETSTKDDTLKTMQKIYF